MSKTYSAGIVTAYGAAKRAGYQGTYEDFCRQQAGYAGNAAAVEAAKTAAQTAANTATAKAGEATTAATAAQTAKTQTEAAASQALTDIGTARSGAISAVQTEGQTQTANARAQAQAAATSATTASTKASEASASATIAGQSATNAATSATSAATSASAAQAVLESIPEDYSDLSEDVDKLKADLSYDIENIIANQYDTTTNLLDFTYEKNLWKQGAPNADQVYTVYFDKKYNVAEGQIIYGAVKPQSISGFRLVVFEYNSNDQFISRVQLAYNGQAGSYTVPSNVSYVYFGFTTNNTTVPITPEQIVALGNTSYAGSESVTATDFPVRYVPTVQNISKELAYYDLSGINMIVGAIKTVSEDDVVDIYDSSIINYRITTSKIHKYDIPIAFTPKSGYRMYFYTKANGETTYTGSGWKTTAFTVPAQTKWTITVARNPEDTSVLADLETFAKAVKTSVPISTLKTRVDYLVKVTELAKQTLDVSDINVKYIDRIDALTQLTRMPMFLIFTDIHGFGNYLERIGDFHDANLPTYCKDVICLGDMVHDKFSDDFTFMSNSDFGKTALVTIGNHDCYDGTTVGGVPITDMYAKFFVNVSLWGVTQPANAAANGYMYYYKDYDSDIRLIVLDEYYWDATQLAWFENTLESARTSGLSVIVAQHQGNFTETEYTRLAGGAFCTDEKTWVRYTTGYTDRRNAINTFIGNGGDFVGWINGHTHWEKFGTFNVNNVTHFNMTFANAGQDISGRMKIPNYSQDCFYYLGIDTTEKRVYVLTIGQAENKWFKRNLMLAYDYANHEVIQYY